MARLKNALTGYFIQKWSEGDTSAGEEWLELARYIETVDDASNEESDAIGFYDGDGNPSDEVTSHQLGYEFSGYFDADDDAMALVEGMIGTAGIERKVWLKVVSADGKRERIGKATVKEPVAQVGDANEYGDFSCTITYDQRADWENTTAPEALAYKTVVDTPEA